MGLPTFGLILKKVPPIFEETTLHVYKNNFIIVLVSTTDTSLYDDLGDKKRVVSHYRHFQGNESICRSECDNDPACNAYATDNNGCFLSICDAYIDVPGCGSCTFSSKITNSSSVNCSKVSTAIIPCVCLCKDVNQTTEEAIERRRNELFLNKTKLSSAIRKLTSAQDNRMSSKVIGTVSVIILVLLGMLLFCADICFVVLFFFRKCLNIVRLSK